ncbi:MAG: TrmH family RNA methyltransferase [Aquaticitalea sp.]
MQHSHHTTNFHKKQHSIVLVCDNISKAPNIGSLFRTADAFGIEKLIFCGIDIPIGRRMTKTSRATEKNVTYELMENTLDALMALKSQDYFIVSLEITSDSQSISKFKFPNQPIALIVGDENHGVSDLILDESDVTLHIEMFGQNSSMNVVQASAIALYELTKQLST